MLTASILLAGAALIWVVTSYGATPALTTVAARGMLTLGSGEFVWDAGPPASCSGYKSSADLGRGTQVTVTSAAGVVLALGSINDSTPILDKDNKGKGCMLAFAVLGIPRGRGPYGVQLGHRDPLHFNEADLPNISIGIGVVL